MLLRVGWTLVVVVRIDGSRRVMTGVEMKTVGEVLREIYYGIFISEVCVYCVYF